MDSIPTKRYEMLRRTRDFGVAQTAAFPEGSFGKELFATVAQVVAELDAHSTSQSSGIGAAQSIAATKSGVREDLREMILAINHTARVLAFEMPGLENQFRLPRGTNDQALPERRARLRRRCRAAQGRLPETRNAGGFHRTAHPTHRQL